MSQGQGPTGGGERDDAAVDAEFAALMAGLGGLGSELDDGAVLDDVPAFDGGAGPDGAAAGEAGPAGAAEASGPKAVKVGLVLTPVARADALAALCAMSDLDCVVLPTSTGAVAVKEFVSAHAEWDVSELLGGAEAEPAEAAELASVLSRLARGGVVLLTADLATDVGIEKGLSGTITARRYENGGPGEEVSAGLLLASTDEVVEDVLLGVVQAQEAPGALRSSEVSPGRLTRWIGRNLRRDQDRNQD